MLHTLSIQTHRRVEFISITSQVERVVRESGMTSGLCVVYVPHTTAGVTINENADPSVVEDIIMELNRTIPFDDGYSHAEGNSAAHIKAVLVGNSQSIPVVEGRLLLGTWQGIFFCEFDGPRHRQVHIKLIEEG